MKVGLDYFPLDCVLDTKVALIEAEFGLNGFGVVVKLFQKIYGEQGYYFEWTNEVALLFAREVGLGCNVVSEILSAAIRRGIFDKKLFDQYQVLTSKGIQKRYLEAVSRRKQVEIKNDYLLLKVSNLGENVHILRENVDRNTKNVDIPKQSKESKESKESNMPAAKAPGRKIIVSFMLEDGTYHDVYEDRVERWKKLYPLVDIPSQFERMIEWIDNNPTKRKTERGINRFITSWLSKEQDKEKRMRQRNRLSDISERDYTEEQLIASIHDPIAAYQEQKANR